MSTMKIGQMINYCEDEAVNKKFYPVSLLQALYDARTGVRLDRILASINSIYLPYAGNFGQTLLQVPLEARRVGLIVTFRDLLGVINTVRYKDTNTTINDEAWSNQANWEGWTFDNAIEDLAEALNVIFKDIDSYPTFKQYLNDTLNVLIKEYVDQEEVKKAFADILLDQIKAVAKEHTETVWHNVTNYAGIVEVITNGTIEAANQIFDNIDAHIDLRDTILNHIEALMTDKITDGVNQFFINIKNNEDSYNIFISAIDNKVHDVFYNVLDYKDVADIIRTEWQAKLDNMQDDDGIKELINTLVHDYLKKLLTDADAYPEVANVFNTYVAETTKNVFLNVSKYAELVGTIENSLHDTVELMINDIEHHTSLVSIINRAVQEYICNELQAVSPESGIGQLMVTTISNTITDIFNNLENYPLFKLKFDILVKDQLQDVVNNIEDYPEVNYLLSKLARDKRTKIVSFKSKTKYDIITFKGLVGQAISNSPVEEVLDDGHSIGDVAIIEFDITDTSNPTIPLQGYLLGSITKCFDNGNISILVEAAIACPYDVRVANLIKALNFNPNGTFSNIEDDIVASATNAKEVIENILAYIKNLNTKYEELNNKVDENFENSVHKDDVGKLTPSLDEDGYIKDEFINNKYQNVHYGQYINETCFINDEDNSVINPKTDCIYVDITDASEYYWNAREEKYKVLNEPIKIGDGHGEAFEGWRGKHLEDVALSLPKNIVSDIEQARRFTDFVQIKYRSRTKSDHQTYSEPFDRTINLYPATEQLAGVLEPYDKYKLNHFGDFVFDFIKNHPEEVLDAITPKGYQFVVVKSSDVDTHKVTIPDGWDTVKVTTNNELPPIWESPDKYASVVLAPDKDAIEDEIYLNGREIIEVPDGYSPVLVKQH